MIDTVPFHFIQHYLNELDLGKVKRFVTKTE